MSKPSKKPKIKRSKQGRELRVSKNAQFTVSVRQKGDGTNGKVIGGLAVVWAPAVSEDLGGFFECIDSHAFDAHLATSPDVRACFNHSADHILGRTKAGTLRLHKTNAGLSYEIDAAPTTVTTDLIVSMQRGDVTQSSFSFTCEKDSWEERADGTVLRTVLEAKIFDVSPVTWPAYPDATSGVLRSRANTNSCPASLRSKLKRNEDEDDLEDDPESEDGTPNENGCECDCPECMDEDDCENCSDPSCDDPNCLANQERAAHLAALMRRLRA